MDKDILFLQNMLKWVHYKGVLSWKINISYNQKKHIRYLSMQILQCYSTHEEELLKQILEAQKEAADPLDKVLQIFDAKVIVSLKFAKLGRELYVCALHYYDENLFDDTTPLYVKVKEALDECVKKKLYSFNEDTRRLHGNWLTFPGGLSSIIIWGRRVMT